MKIPLTLALFLVAPAARAEVFTLIDNTQVSGKLLHYYEGSFAVETAGGQKLEIPREKLKSITFALPAPRAELSSPEKTFARWRDSVVKGDLSRMVDCYALMYQGLVHAQTTGDELKKMQKELDGVRFDVKGAKVTGDTATVKVQKTHGDDVMTADLHMVMENGEWKMVPTAP